MSLSCSDCKYSCITPHNYLKCKITGNCYIPSVMTDKISEYCPLYVMLENDSDYDLKMRTQLEILHDLPDVPQRLSDRDREALEWAVKLSNWYIENKERICLLP